MTGTQNSLRPRVAPWVVWSLTCGLLSVGCPGLVVLGAIASENMIFVIAPAFAPLGVCAIDAARVAMRTIASQPERYRGRGAAVAGAALGWSGVIICALSLATVLALLLVSVVD